MPPPHSATSPIPSCTVNLTITDNASPPQSSSAITTLQSGSCERMRTRSARWFLARAWVGLYAHTRYRCSDRSHRAPLRPPLAVASPAPSVSVIGGPYNVTAGATANLTGNATCFGGGACAGYLWTVVCPPVNATSTPTTVTAATVNTSITTGPSFAYQINTYGLVKPIVCSVNYAVSGERPWGQAAPELFLLLLWEGAMACCGRARAGLKPL